MQADEFLSDPQAGEHEVAVIIGSTSRSEATKCYEMASDFPDISSEVVDDFTSFEIGR